VRIVVAPNAFKGSLSARDAAKHIARGVRSALPGAEVVTVPVADGGDGTVDAAIDAGFERRTATVTGPTGGSVAASYAIRQRSAVVEMAAASGLAVLPGGHRRPTAATSRGTGELVRAALDNEAESIVLGVGGSARTDGGAGCLVGLGARVLDADGGELPPGGASLARAVRLDLTALDRRLADVQLVLATDVDNPLLGPAGAAAIFAPQKGASASEATLLEQGLACWADVVAAEVGIGVPPFVERPGSGAGGGIGFAGLAVLGAVRRPGVDVVLEMVEFQSHLDDADLVITGEGALDAQTLRGKAPAGVCAAAGRIGVPTIALAGSIALTPNELAGAGFAAAHALTALEPNPARSRAMAGILLERLAGSAVANWRAPA
jgi:glycerate kinase